MVAAQLFFLKNVSQGSPIPLAWYLSNQILEARPCLNIHHTSSTESNPGPWEAVQSDLFWGGLFVKDELEEPKWLLFMPR